MKTVLLRLTFLLLLLLVFSTLIRHCIFNSDLNEQKTIGVYNCDEIRPSVYLIVSAELMSLLSFLLLGFLSVCRSFCMCFVSAY